MTRAYGATAHLARIARFVSVRHKPHYVLYGVLWVLAVESTTALVSRPDEPWRPSGNTVLRIVAVTVMLLYLRLVDEQKDLAYDREHNPDRPLVTGAVSAGELQSAMVVSAAIAVLASAALSWGSVVLIVLALGYGVALWAIERCSRTVRENLLVNLVVTYPIQLWLLAYVVVSAVQTGQADWDIWDWGVAVVFTGAFLQFEFARRTARDQDPSLDLYSNSLGARGSAAAAVGCAVLAVVSDVALAQPWDRPGWQAALTWLPVVLLVAPWYAGVSFVRGRRAAYPIAPSVIFVVALYCLLIVQGLVEA